MWKFVLAVCVTAGATASAAPMTFTHTGRLLDAAGGPLHGDMLVTVALFDSQAGGSELWTQTQTIAVADGHYTMVLGGPGGVALDPDDFAGTTPFLEVQVGGVAVGPRRELTAVPYALSAAAVDGGPVNATEVSVAGHVVINASGQVPLARVEGAQARVSGSCSVGQAITAINADGSVTCGEAGGAFADRAVNANVTMPAQTTAANSWGTLSMSGVSVGSGVTLMNNQWLFDSPGIYRITLDYRAGSGTDVWTAVRLFGDEGTRGISAGYGVNGTASPDVFGVTFLAAVTNATVPYELQIARRGTPHVIVNPSSIAGQALPALTATVERVSGLSGSETFADLHAAAHTFEANSWTPISFNGVGTARGVSVSGGSNVQFATGGTYQMDVTYRHGTGGDVWTAFGVYDGGTNVARSVGFGNLTNSHEVVHASLIASVDAGTAYTLRMGRLSSAATTDNPSDLAGVYAPSINVVITPVDPAAHAQLEGNGQTFGSGWTPVTFTGASISSGVDVAGSDITFAEPGLYRIGLSHRNGTGGDVWTGVRLVDSGGVTRGVSTGYGNDTNSPELQAVQFLADVTDTTAPHQVELGRLVSSLAVANTTPIAGVALPAVVATITRVSAP